MIQLQVDNSDHICSRPGLACVFTQTTYDQRPISSRYVFFFNPWWQKTAKLWLVYWQNDWNELLVCRLYQNNIVSFGQTKSLVFVFLLWLGSVGAHGSRKSYVAKMSHRAFAGLIQWSRSCVHANSSLYLQSVKKNNLFLFCICTTTVDTKWWSATKYVLPLTMRGVRIGHRPHAVYMSVRNVMRSGAITSRRWFE